MRKSSFGMSLEFCIYLSTCTRFAYILGSDSFSSWNIRFFARFHVFSQQNQSQNKAPMTGLSEKAFATMAICEETKRPFGITVDYVSQRHYKFVWAFKIDREKAHREGYDTKTVTGSVELDPDYPGCPYCGTKDFYICGCGKVVCYHGQQRVTCPECGQVGEITQVSEISLRGGGY